MCRPLVCPADLVDDRLQDQDRRHPEATTMTMKRTIAALTLLPILLAVKPAFAQVTATVTDISPDSSTLDASDPDGASGGRVNGIGAARQTPGTFYVASEWGGLFRSTDSGVTWAHVEGHVPTTTWDVEVDPSNSNRVYATSFYDGRVASRSGINVSTDGGVTWTHPATATPPANFCLNDARRTESAAFGIAIDPANTNVSSSAPTAALRSARTPARRGRSSIRRRSHAPTMCGTSSCITAASSMSAATMAICARPTAVGRGRPPPP